MGRFFARTLLPPRADLDLFDVLVLLLVLSDGLHEVFCLFESKLSRRLGSGLQGLLLVLAVEVVLNDVGISPEKRLSGFFQLLQGDFHVLSVKTGHWLHSQLPALCLPHKN